MVILQTLRSSVYGLFCREQKFNRGLSFETISSSGYHAAIIHYMPSNKTDKQITANEIYLLDSGGQYM